MYKWDPDDYHRHSSAQECIAEDVISGLKVEGNEFILDIGCGDGKVTSKLASLVPQGRVLGIDSSKKMIDFCRKKFPTSNYTNLEFEHLNALDMKFESNFDLVTSFACLHWVKDHLAVLRNIKRSLKPGGKLLLQCAGRRIGNDLTAAGRDVIRSDKWKKYFREFSNPYGMYSPDEYHDCLALTGLEELKVELTVEEMILPGKAGLEGFIRTTWLPITESVTEEHRWQLIREISERYIENHPLRDNLAIVNMSVLLVEARRHQSSKISSESIVSESDFSQ
jgi:trans-aconitate 2-methyltransferase